MKIKNFVTGNLTIVFTRGDLVIGAIKVEQKDGTHKIRIILFFKVKMIGFQEFYFNEINTKAFKLMNYGINLNCLEIQMILSAINVNYEDMKVIPYVNGIGWQYDKVGKIKGHAGVNVLDVNGNELIKDYQANLPSSKGTISYLQVIREYLLMKPIRQAIFLTALSSIIAGLLRKNILMSIIGSSSTGKTTIARLGVSIFGDPLSGMLSQSFNATENCIAKKLDGNYGANTLLDYTSLSKAKDFTVLLYQLAEGKERSRLVKGNEIGHCATWNTTVTMTGEKSILGMCNSELGGTVGRNVEIHVHGNDLFDSPQEAEKIRKLSMENHGIIEPLITKYLFENGYISTIENKHHLEVEAIRNVIDDNDELIFRLTEIIGMVTLTGKIARDVLGIDFDIEGVKQYLLNAVRENVENYREMQPSNRVLNEVYPMLVNYAQKNCQHKREDYIVIEPIPFKNLLKKVLADTGIKPIDVKSTLKTHDLLEVKGSLYGYIGTFNNDTVRGYAIKINEKYLEGTDNDE